MAREAHRTLIRFRIRFRAKEKKICCLSFPHAAEELLPEPEEDAEEVFEKHGKADHAIPASVNSAEFLR
jgi:hypothetical protein